MPLFTDAYLGDTTHLSTFEHGAYLLLLIVAWRSPGCCIADDDGLLARYTRMTRDKWRKVRPIVAPFFTIEDGFWHQARLQNELQHLQSRRQQQVEAGNASAIAKSLKRGNRRSTPVGKPLQRDGNETPTPISYPVPLSNDNGADSDKALWDAAKSYLSSDSKNPGALIGKWVRDHGKNDTAAAITRAQLERPVEKIPFIEGILRKQAKEREPPVWDGMP